LSFHGLSIPPGSVGDGLKRLAPLFEPVYAALEERSRTAAWWQADETRWNVFETTKNKTSFRWYLWVFISDESIVHVIDPTRSAQVIQEHLGEKCNGILLVDRYAAYKSYASKREGVTWLSAGPTHVGISGKPVCSIKKSGNGPRDGK
jgi:transposase